MLAIMKKLKYDDEYNFENEVKRRAAVASPLTPFSRFFMSVLAFTACW